MKNYPNLRRAVAVSRRFDGTLYEFSLDQLLKWAPHLEEIDMVFGKMSRSDLEDFVSPDGDPSVIKKLIRTLPVEWGKTKRTQDQWRKSLRLADKFLNIAY